MTSLEEELLNTSDAAKTGKFVEMKSNLMNWIHNAEGVLLSEHPVINSLHIMENQLKRLQVIFNPIAIWSSTYSGMRFQILYLYYLFQDLEATISDHNQEIEFINKVADGIFQENKEDRLQEELKELNTRWADIPVVLQERCVKLEDGTLERYFWVERDILWILISFCYRQSGIKELKELHKKMSNFSDWLEEIKFECFNSSDLDTCILNPDLFNEKMERRKVVNR